MPTIGRRRGAPLRTTLAASVHGWLAARRGLATSGQDVRERFAAAGLLALLDMEDRGEVAYSTTAGWSTVRPGIMAHDGVRWHRVAALSLDRVAYAACGRVLDGPPVASGEPTCAVCAGCTGEIGACECSLCLSEQAAVARALARR